MKKFSMIVLVMSVAGLAACGGKPLIKDYGATTHNNVGKQTINQDAPADDTELTLDGARAENIIERYRAEKAQGTDGGLIETINN
ncbi:MAG TPA: hypothetical protein VIN71_03585 [Pseudomonadales bacterium]